jgi:hypothetical protein
MEAERQVSCSKPYCNQLSDDEMEDTVAVVSYLVMKKLARLREKKKRRFWVRPWITRRQQLGAYDNLMQELAAEDIPGYIAFQRVHPQVFEEILDSIRPLIQRQDTNMRRCIPPEVRLALTLRYLATGNYFVLLP